MRSAEGLRPHRVEQLPAESPSDEERSLRRRRPLRGTENHWQRLKRGGTALLCPPLPGRAPECRRARAQDFPWKSATTEFTNLRAPRGRLHPVIPLNALADERARQGFLYGDRLGVRRSSPGAGDDCVSSNFTGIAPPPIRTSRASPHHLSGLAPNVWTHGSFHTCACVAKLPRAFAAPATLPFSS
jgi:hypothetical protein